MSDTNIKSARDVMLAMGIPNTPTNVIAEKVIGRKILSRENPKNFCVFCKERMKRVGMDWKMELQPLHYVTYKCLCMAGEQTGEIIIDKRYICPNCKKENTQDDFIKAYSKPYEEFKNERFALTPEEIRKHGFEV